MSDIYTFVCCGVLAVLFLIVICSIILMIVAFSSDNPPSRNTLGTHIRHMDSCRNIRDEYISQERVRGGV